MNRIATINAELRAGAASGVFCFAVGLFCLPSLGAQTPDEHASHHPAPAGGTTPAGAASPAVSAAPGGAGGMMSAMGDMMKGMMGGAPPKELYPTLMALPGLTPQQRKQVEQQADERMNVGTKLMGEALDSLNAGAKSNNYGAMNEAMSRLREGAAQLESGVAARRALAEGRAPREVALAWFKREMSLATPVVGEASHGAAGLSLFHLFTMGLLVAFAFAMLAMYFLKMRRAAALFGRIEPGTDTPPPGSSPSLGGPSGIPPSPREKASPGVGGSSPPSAKPEEPEKLSAPTASDQPTSSREASVEKSVTSPPQHVTSPATTTPTSNAAAPLTAKWVGRLRVESIVRETPSVLTFRLRSPDSDVLPFTFAPGQFLNVAFAVGGARMNRSYSISSSPNERGFVELTVKREERGALSRHIVDLLDVGDEIEAGGPVGKFTFDGTEANSVVLVGAGVGITPMMSIARYLTEQSWPGEIFFIYGCRSPADLIFGKAISALALRNPNLRVAITMSKPTPDWKGSRGRITKEFLLQAVPNLAARRVQLCGPPTMMDAIKALLTDIGVSHENLNTEAFGAVKPPPASPGTSAIHTAAATGPLVTFSQNNKSAKIQADQTILELSEDLGIGIEFSCRVGTCGLCKVKMTKGEVDMKVDDALDDDDKANGIILACQAKPKVEVTVEA